MSIETLKEVLGLMSKTTVTCLDKSNLIVKSGINTISSLAGEGKTTFILKFLEQQEKNGYNTIHINFDLCPLNADTYNPPRNSEEFEKVLEILSREATDRDIVVIDSLKMMATTLNLDIEDNADVIPLMQKMRIVCRDTGVTIILVHHAYKAKNVKTANTHFYGARAIEEQSDSGFIYIRANENQTAKIVKNRAGHSRDALVEIVL